MAGGIGLVRRLNNTPAMIAEWEAALLQRRGIFFKMSQQMGATLWTVDDMAPDAEWSESYIGDNVAVNPVVNDTIALLLDMVTDVNGAARSHPGPILAIPLPTTPQYPVNVIAKHVLKWSALLPSAVHARVVVQRRVWCTRIVGRDDGDIVPRH